VYARVYERLRLYCVKKKRIGVSDVLLYLSFPCLFFFARPLVFFFFKRCNVFFYKLLFSCFSMKGIFTQSMYQAYSFIGPHLANVRPLHNKMCTTNMCRNKNIVSFFFMWFQLYFLTSLASHLATGTGVNDSPGMNGVT
jgi:hypothetical protein